MNLIQILIGIILSVLYLFVAYNIPILAVGFRENQRSDKNKKTIKKKKDSRSLPSFSIIVPMKNEERVAERILKALLRLEYPTKKKEIIVVEDGSIDKTLNICQSVRRLHPNQITILHKMKSNGKPSALNYATEYAKGDIIAIFDADNVPDSDVLLKAAEHFEDLSISALQGTTCSLNADENRLTKFLSYEEAVWLKTYIRGKDALNLFVPLTGSCQFVRRNILLELGGWDGRIPHGDQFRWIV